MINAREPIMVVFFYPGHDRRKSIRQRRMSLLLN
jgi:hypothetical protein